MFVLWDGGHGRVTVFPSHHKYKFKSKSILYQVLAAIWDGLCLVPCFQSYPLGIQQLLHTLDSFIRKFLRQQHSVSGRKVRDIKQGKESNRNFYFFKHSK